ncbi:MAG: hypothetical protein PWP51_1104 [Clostridiales bacterium]|jgi:hypothetical protein|nr:hypothetical protein [Clostridiales bacterium]MDN5298551.1 hypothetical protein [Clostridiales bacterium]
MLEMFIKSIKLDDAGRIVIVIQDHLSEYFVKEDSKKMLKDMAVKTLGDDFIKLEMSKVSARVTVREGQSEVCKARIQEELTKGIEMAMQFMSQMQDGQESAE